MEVTPAGPATKAGVRAKDVIVSIGDSVIRNVDDLYRGLDEPPIGGSYGATILRDGATLEMAVETSSKPGPG